MAVANTPAYYDMAQIITVNSFIVHTPVLLKPFTAIIVAIM